MFLLNMQRLRVYSRLILLITWVTVGINVFFHQGWIGWLGQVIGSDFITCYAAGIVYRTSPDLAGLYDFETQGQIQAALIAPSPLTGVNPFISPPYVAYAYSALTYLPLPWAFSLWSCAALLCTAGAVRCLMPLLPSNIRGTALSYNQFLMLVLSFFPFIEGLQVGQNHALTLLLVTCIVVCMLSQRWAIAGVAAGLLLYKPQFVVGFLLLWMIWRQHAALLAFSSTALLWIGSFILLKGTGPLLSYLDVSGSLVLLPYVEGFPGYLLLTVYGFLASIFHLLPEEWFQVGSLRTIQQTIFIISQGLFLLLGAGLAWLAYRLRNQPVTARSPAILLALLWPLVACPCALLHDMLILIPFFALWVRQSSSPKVLSTISVVYLGALVLTPCAALTKVAFMSVLVFGTLCLLLQWIATDLKDLLASDVSGQKS